MVQTSSETQQLLVQASQPSRQISVNSSQHGFSTDAESNQDGCQGKKREETSVANHLEDKEQKETLATNQVEEQAEHSTHDVTVFHTDIDTLSGPSRVEDGDAYDKEDNCCAHSHHSCGNLAPAQFQHL